MSTAITNGSAMPWGEAGGGWGESEWASPEYTPEAGWAPEAWPESEQEIWPEAGWVPEGEWAPEAWPESEQEIWPESEWAPESWAEAEWTPEVWPESEVMDEADPFLPLLAAPLLAPLAAQAAKSLLPLAANAAGDVMKGVLGGVKGMFGGGGGRRRPPRRRPAKPGSAAGRPAPSPGAPPAGGLAGLLAGLPPGAADAIRQLAGPLAAGAAAAAQAEASFYGSNEFLGEVAASDQAREAALTEVLAAEAAHTPDDREAVSLLGATVPLTIKIMGARGVQPLMPSLARANFRLVQSMRDSGPSGPQLLRLVPKILRNSVGTVSAAANRAGRPLPPRLVAPVVAAQAGKVMTDPRIAGPALARNSAIRQATVARPSARAY